MYDMCCHVLQCVAAHCNTLQHMATHDNTCRTSCRTCSRMHAPQHNASHGNTRQHTATHSNTLSSTRTIPQRHTLWMHFLGWTHSNNLQHTATHHLLQDPYLSTTHFDDILYFLKGEHTASHCNTLQHTATLCNTLQHTAFYTNHTSAPHTLMTSRTSSRVSSSCCSPVAESVGC